MKAIKRGIAFALGGLTTIGLLYLMSELINTEFIAPPEGGNVKIPDIRMANTEIETRIEDAKPEKPVEQEAPPELPQPEFEA
jgi:protein TonB